MKVIFHTGAEDADVWDDACFAAAYWAAVAAETLDASGGLDACELDPWLLPDDAVAADRLGEEPVVSDPYALVERADAVARAARASAAAQDLLFHQVLAAAAADPVPWVGADPTVDPLWRDPRGWTVGAVREHRRSLAVRSAAADIGARVQLTDNQVRNRAHRAKVLSERTPRVWAACREGAVSEQNAMIAAELAFSLPDDPGVWAAFDEGIADAAVEAVPARFRTRARAVRERVHRESLAERHARAAKDRRVEVTPELDGMAYLGALLPAEKAHAIDGELEQRARHLAGLPDETRTLAQLRADVFADLLTDPRVDDSRTDDSRTDGFEQGAASEGDERDARKADATKPTHPGRGRRSRRRARATVRITIPALTLLGHGDEPATLDGYGPIPLDTARELAAEASSWIRVLTHPATGTIVDVDRRAYRVPADLRRLLHALHPTCVFPGCSRPADACDVDHRRRWVDGGTTSASNGQPMDPPHHHLKDETLWRSALDPGTGRVVWTSPSGFTIGEDPPPF